MSGRRRKPRGARPRALGALRRRRKLSTGDLAERLSMDQRSYERLEAGTIGLSVNRLLAFAAACEGDAPAILAALARGTPALATITADSRLFCALAERLLQLSPAEAAQVSRASRAQVDEALDRLITRLTVPTGAP